MAESIKPTNSIVYTAVQVISNPRKFFSSMPREGGFKEPMTFFFAMAAIGWLINLTGTTLILGKSSVVSFLVMAIVGPAILFLSGFLGALILHIIWQILGSDASYETSYRTLAYATGISPLTSLISFIPVVGVPFSIAWAVFLIIIGSVEVHKIKNSLAWAVWGVVGLFLVVSTVVVQLNMHKTMPELRAFSSVEVTK
ncbi:MAG: YIP1 family protein [Nitrospirae bacterium]|nr:YIP1 family protein [Nitrospirota bacterium]